ncbi:Uncharacterised protein [Yersinia kristensenii]|nr:Uncharacterised protein [Yersinia kristensenii]
MAERGVNKVILVGNLGSVALRRSPVTCCFFYGVA